MAIDPDELARLRKSMQPGQSNPVAASAAPVPGGLPLRKPAKGGANVRPGYDMSPTIRGAQTADDRKMQAAAVAPVVRPGYDAMPTVRNAQAAADSNMQAGAVPATRAPGASIANGAVDSAMQVGGLRNADSAQRALIVDAQANNAARSATDAAMQAGATRNADSAQRALIGEGLVGHAAQGAIQTALTPASRAPITGNPERAAAMQAQFDQPVTKGGIPVAAGIPVRGKPSQPGVASTFAGGLGGAVKAAAGTIAWPASALYDGVRNMAGTLSGGDTSQIKQYRDGAAALAGEGIDQMADSAAALREGAATNTRNMLGIDKAPAATTTPAPASGTAYSGQAFDQWTQQQRGLPRASSSEPAAAATPTQAPQGSGYVRTGIGEGRQGGEIVGRMGANGVPEFTNNRVAQEGAGAQPKGGLARVGDGKGGTFSVGEEGDAQLAMERFGRANQIRAEMNANRPRELGDNGGQLNVIRDSSRAPSIAEMLHAKLESRQAQTEAQRSEAQLGFRRDAREDAKLELDRQRLSVDQQKGEIEAQAAQIGLQASQRLNQIRTQLADPALPADQRAQLEQAYATLTTDAKDRYMTVVGGENEMGAKQASTVFDRLTGATVGAQSATQGEVGGQGAQFQNGKIYKDPTSGARAMFKGTDANGNPIWEELN